MMTVGSRSRTNGAPALAEQLGRLNTTLTSSTVVSFSSSTVRSVAEPVSRRAGVAVQLALEFRQHQSGCLRGTGGGRMMLMAAARARAVPCAGSPVAWSLV